jgi:hypothetical protein
MNNPVEQTETPAVAVLPPAPRSGFKAWAPLLVTILLLPGLAFVVTNFMLIPKLVRNPRSETVHARENPGEGSNSASQVEGKPGGEGREASRPKIKD